MAETTSHVLVIICIVLSILSEYVIGFSIELTRIDHIESSLFPKSITLEERHERLARISQARLLHLSSRRRSPVSIYSAFNTPIWNFDHNFYFTKVFIGSTHFATFLMVDSGSDVTWVQSEHCYQCFKLQTEDFDEESSSTFYYLPCNHPLCIPRRCQRDLCIYNIKYDDNTFSKGYVGADTFRFATKNGTYASIPGIAFGCGYNSSENMFGTRDPVQIGGLFALGPTNGSFIMKHESITDGVFSYCLPHMDAPGEPKTYLQFGNSTRSDARTRSAQTVRLMPGDYYMVELVGISVGNNQLVIPKRFFDGGLVIDTGSSYSVLVKGAYLQVRGEMIKYFKQHYGWDPLIPHAKPFPLCYNMSTIRNNNVVLPPLTFHFNGGAAFQAAAIHTFTHLSDGRLCLAVIRDQNGPNVLGAFQMANQRFIVDAKARQMTFLPENCLENS